MMGPKEGLPFLERKRGLSFPHRRWGTGALREAREAVGGWEAFGLPDEATPQTPKLFLGGRRPPNPFLPKKQSFFGLSKPSVLREALDRRWGKKIFDCWSLLFI
jgi:hypothetical protein